ncbi:MAG: hypothetical protein AAFO91_03990 [Bacteroidota bacterium]
MDGLGLKVLNYRVTGVRLAGAAATQGKLRPVLPDKQRTVQMSDHKNYLHFFWPAYVLCIDKRINNKVFVLSHCYKYSQETVDRTKIDLITKDLFNRFPLFVILFIATDNVFKVILPNQYFPAAAAQGEKQLTTSDEKPLQAAKGSEARTHGIR